MATGYTSGTHPARLPLIRLFTATAALEIPF
jgi:hypothetical protein